MARATDLVFLKLISGVKKHRVLILVALILPTFRLVALIYGNAVAPPGHFVPLLGDSWGAAELIQQVSEGRTFPMGDPSNASASLLIYPPGYFVGVSALHRATGLPVPYSIQVMGIIIDIGIVMALYKLARFFMKPRACVYAVLLLVLPGSLAWLRTVPMVSDPDVFTPILSGITSGSTKIDLPQDIKDRIYMILTGSHRALFDAMRMSYEWLAHSFGMASLILMLCWSRSGDRRYLAISGISLGLVNLVHPYALFGWDLLFTCGLWQLLKIKFGMPGGYWPWDPSP